MMASGVERKKKETTKKMFSGQILRRLFLFSFSFLLFFIIFSLIYHGVYNEPEPPFCIYIYIRHYHHQEIVT